ncbi:MAG: hypothetical protein LKJ47_07300 [Bifidobacteriaceae bacterium]|nr:hypothetical protein [Bifidobacteriaceae bacterium]
MGETGFCPNCGSFTIGMTPFCVNCGARLESSEKLRQYGSVDATLIGGSGLSRLGVAPSRVSAVTLSPSGNISHKATPQKAAHRAPQRPFAWRKLILLSVIFASLLAVSAGVGGIYMVSHRNDAAVASCQQATDHLLDANDALKGAVMGAQSLTATETELVLGTPELASWQQLESNAPTAAAVPQCASIASVTGLHAATSSASASAKHLGAYATQLNASTASLRNLISTQEILARSQTAAAITQSQE